MAENDDSIIEVKDDVSVAEAKKWSRQSIYKIPATFTAQHKKKAYKPQMVSIGPYHQGEPRLKAMETHKHRAQRHFLARLGKPVEFLLHELRPDVQDFKDAYDQLDDDKWQGDDDKAFLELMVLDGCFILEMLRTTAGEADENSKEGYPENDPIFSDHGKYNIVPYLKRDMLMLENQIPLALLQKLHAVNPIQKGSNVLTTRILNLFSQIVHYKNLMELSKCPHILDLYRKNLIYDPVNTKRKLSLRVNNTTRCGIIRSATDLRDAGITIKASDGESLSNISFHQPFCGLFGAVLRLPCIEVDDAFKSTYLNMIAYEHFHVGAGNDVTSYIFFMDSIIDNVHDVRLLVKGGVIQNALGSGEAMAKLFNSLSADSALNPNSKLAQVHGQVSSYCKRHRHQWIGYCGQHYFTNPWVAVTVVAAILIFGLTVLQTIYSALSYHKDKPKKP